MVTVSKRLVVIAAASVFSMGVASSASAAACMQSAKPVVGYDYIKPTVVGYDYIKPTVVGYDYIKPTIAN